MGALAGMNLFDGLIYFFEISASFCQKSTQPTNIGKTLTVRAPFISNHLIKII